MNQYHNILQSHLEGDELTSVTIRTHNFFWGGDELTCFDQSEAEKLSQIHRQRINILSGPALRAAPAKTREIFFGTPGRNAIKRRNKCFLDRGPIFDESDFLKNCCSIVVACSSFSLVIKKTANV